MDNPKYQVSSSKENEGQGIIVPEGSLTLAAKEEMLK